MFKSPTSQSSPIQFGVDRSMRPLTSLLCVLLLEASCRGFKESDLKYLENMWLSTIRKSNEKSLRQSKYSDDFQQLLDLLSELRTSENRWNFFQDIKSVLVQNSYEKIFGHKIGMFTNYCGPGDTAGPRNETVCGLLNGVDECCKAHDSCENYIVSKNDYEVYPNLPQRTHYFTSLSCECDVNFYNCVKQTNSIIGELILAIYSVAQISCFQHEYKIERCMKYDE